jgi:RNA polymerase sigma-70 factor (ECF subfamily)
LIKSPASLRYDRAMQLHEVTHHLKAWNRGDRQAMDSVFAELINELRQLAAAHLRREREGHTLQPTAVVNELYLRLAESNQTSWQDRAHFFAFAATTIRRILVDHARQKRAAKRGGDNTQVTLSEWAAWSAQRSIDLLDLDQALLELGQADERLHRVVELRFFGGLTVEEIAEVLDLGTATVNRDLRSAKALLLHRLKRPGSAADPTPS